jgi:NAD(P)-dependent dehydrogenase (short-subunit alcohol dehydrogenase family)
VLATSTRLESLEGLSVAERLALDVTDPVSIDAALARVGEIDVLVNNAGLSMWAPLELSPPDRVERLFNTNVLGAIRMCQAVLPGMRARRKGRIIQISSAAARRPQPGVGIYCASKAALESFSMAARLEMRPFGVEVAVIGMGAVATDIDSRRYVADGKGTDYERMMSGFIERTHAVRSRAVEPLDVAKVIASVIDAERPPFRSYVGEGVGESLDAIARKSDAQYEELYATR